MTALALPGTVGQAPVFDPRALLSLGLPAHVVFRLNGDWTQAWLIGRVHCADGWIALVQYTDGNGREHTLRLPADRVAAR
ncbi:hypothetical protein ACWCOV_08170 [Kribbella sp. NPDC002412]